MREHATHVIASVKARALVAVVLAAVLVLPACGGASPSHDSPSGALAGFADAAMSSDLGGIFEWLPPSQREKVRAAFTKLSQQQFTLSYTEKDFEVVSDSIDPSHQDHATANAKGELDFCVTYKSNKSCSALPGPTAPLRDENTFECVNELGEWYVAPESLGAPAVGPAPPSPSPSPTATPRQRIVPLPRTPLPRSR
ncbi:MAG TPA: hypothetical protein VE219_05600 [Candidatus Sulfotelmatobacter sp.]|nr:hypothetical protein [Candidatus Sulfotelmatobacter sp.]